MSWIAAASDCVVLHSVTAVLAMSAAVLVALVAGRCPHNERTAVATVVARVGDALAAGVARLCCPLADAVATNRCCDGRGPAGAWYSLSLLLGSLHLRESLRSLFNSARRSGRYNCARRSDQSAMIVFDDADVVACVDWILTGILWGSGQVCSATSR